jgi:hypothetical protein
MTKKEAIEKLKAAAKTFDADTAHRDADDILVQYIKDPQITRAYKAVPKWYS